MDEATFWFINDELIDSEDKSVESESESVSHLLENTQKEVNKKTINKIRRKGANTTKGGIKAQETDNRQNMKK